MHNFQRGTFWLLAAGCCEIRSGSIPLPPLQWLGNHLRLLTAVSLLLSFKVIYNSPHSKFLWHNCAVVVFQLSCRFVSIVLIVHVVLLLLWFCRHFLLLAVPIATFSPSFSAYFWTKSHKDETKPAKTVFDPSVRGTGVFLLVSLTRPSFKFDCNTFCGGLRNWTKLFSVKKRTTIVWAFLVMMSSWPVPGSVGLLDVHRPG